MGVNRSGRINVKLVVILFVIITGLGVGLFAARHIRRRILSKMDYDAGTASYEQKDWPKAYKHLREYLGRNPDDLDILKKYADTCLEMRPLKPEFVSRAIGAYRRVLQVNPGADVVYDELATLYNGVGNYTELIYLAQKRLENEPEDPNAPLWLASSLIKVKKPEEAREVLEGFIARLEQVPEKYDQYVQACGQMSRLEMMKESDAAKTAALKWLDKAVEYAPDSVRAYAHRAQFYRTVENLPDLSRDEQLSAARQDLDAADKLGPEDPRMCFSLGAEWLAHGEVEKAAAELEIADKLPQEVLEKYFFDLKDWVVARFLFAAELAKFRGDRAERTELADEVLTALTEERQRMQVLPEAIGMYVAAGMVEKARESLGEYEDLIYKMESTPNTELRLAYLQALVAKLEDKPYEVIDVLQPLVASETAYPPIYILQAEALSKTGQPRRAKDALDTYLRFRPDDAKITFELARHYTRLGEWAAALNFAQRAERMDPANVEVKLLRIHAAMNHAIQRNAEDSSEKVKELLDELAQMHETNPERTEIRTLEAVAWNYLEKPEEAEQRLKQAIAECDDPLAAQMQLAGLYYRTERIDEAMRVCKTASERHAEAADPWVLLSDLYVAQERFEDALKCLKQGLTKVSDANRDALSVKLALLEMEHGERSAGIKILEDMAAEDPGEIQARVLLLQTREKRENPEEFAQIVEELKKAEGQSGLRWRFHQATLWLLSDNWRSKKESVESLLQYCIKANPTWSAPAFLLGSMYERLRDFQQAEKIYRQAISRNPSAADVAGRLLELLAEQDRFTDAYEVLRQVVMDPKFVSAWEARMALEMGGDLSPVIGDLNVRVSNDQKDAVSRRQLAQLIYRHTGDAEEAFKYLKEAEAIDPQSSSLVAIKASILLAEERIDEAKQVLDDYVELREDFSAYWMRATYLARAGEYDSAEQDFIKLTTFPEQGVIGYGLLSNFYASTGKLDKAVASLEEGLAQHEDNADLKRRLMRLLFLRDGEQDNENALALLSELEERFPEDAELLTIRARQMMSREQSPQFVEVREKLEKAIELDPGAVDAHRMLVGIALEQGQYEQARSYAVRAIGSNPDSPQLLAARGWAELALNNNRLAADLAEMVLKQVNSTDAMGLLVTAALKSGDESLLAKAKEKVDMWLTSDPNSEQAVFAKAQVMHSMGLGNEAIPQLESFVQAEPGSSDLTSVIMLADLYRLYGDPQKAELKINQARSIDPNNQAVVHARAMLLLSEKRYSELKGIASEYISSKQQNSTRLLQAASMLAGSGQAELQKEALKLFEYAQEEWPKSLEIRIAQASMLYQTGSPEPAIAIYRDLLEKQPDDIRVLNDLAWILQEHSQDYAAALKLANRGLELAPNDVHLLDTRGVILSKMENRLDEAKQDFQKIVEVATDDGQRKAKALLQLGRVCVKLDELADAKKYMEDALEIDQKLNVFTSEERTEINRTLNM